GTCAKPITAGRRMQARLNQRAAGLDLTGQPLAAEAALRPQRHHGGLRCGTIALFERRLQRPQLIRSHRTSRWSSVTPRTLEEAIVLSMPGLGLGLALILWVRDC